MNAAELLQKMGDTLGSTATVKSVFGEPIHVNGKTVVPVAKVAYGFGGGAGTGKTGRTRIDRAKVVVAAAACARFPRARWKLPKAVPDSCRSSIRHGSAPRSPPVP